MRTRKRVVSTRILAGLSLVALLGSALLAADHPVPAEANSLDGLPTWDEVQAAKENTAAAEAKAVEIEQLIAASEAELTRLRNEHADAVDAFQQAEEEFMAAAQKTATLEAEAELKRAEADAAAEQAAALVSQMYRSGGVDRNLELFLETDGETADRLLERLASMSKATERNTAISDEAEQAMNVAASLGEQAQVAREERERLREEKDQLQQIAAEAVAAQSAAIAAQEADQKVLVAQLAALRDTEAETVDGYEERLRIEEEIRLEQIRLAEEEARRRAEEERRRAEEEAANNPPPPPPGGGGGGGGGNSNGWFSPIPYTWISTTFQAWWGHTGVDLVNNCGVPIVAPNSGTISFVGWMDNIGGNMIYLNHGGGYQTRYAHLSGFNSHHGQSVSQGQVIGYVGTTGLSTGCHLHYEVLLNGIFIDPLGNGFV